MDSELKPAREIISGVLRKLKIRKRREVPLEEHELGYEDMQTSVDERRKLREALRNQWLVR